MAEPDLAGASLPEGIEVDETAAYFGITDSSDIVHQLMSMDRNQSITAFFGMVSEVVLKPGEFDFEEASKLLNCEGGEIYYLVAGHLGLMSFSDPLLHYLGLPDSQGEESPNAKPAITDTQYDSLKRLADPMNILKVLAIAHTTGGPDEVLKYYLTMSEILQQAENNSSLLIDIASEFDASLDVIGHAIPITNLANSTVDTSSISPPAATRPAATSVDLPKVAPPLPVANELEKSQANLPAIEPVPTKSVPLPSSVIPEPVVVEAVQQPALDTNITDRKAAKVTDNAFEGAFGMMAQPDTPTEVSGEIISDVQAIETTESTSEIEVTDENEQTVVTLEETEEEEPFVSAAEMFINADSDDDGTLSVEELATATGLSATESEELHKSADRDNDGKMSLSEFVASPAAEKVAANLPRPVAPVRKPVSRTESRPNAQQNAMPPQVTTPQNIQPRPIPPQNLQPQPVIMPQPMSPPPQINQQPVLNQVVQPTIRSGVSCRSCRIGIDPYWRFCPVCGAQNLN